MILPFMRSIRNSAKAVIVRDGALLVLVKRGPHGPYFIRPGGGQEPGETLEAAVRRECREELGTDVTVGALMCVRDYVAANHEFAADHPEFHAVEFMFACQVPLEDQPIDGPAPDEGQERVEWLPLPELLTAPLYPQSLRSWLLEQDRPVYPGDVN